jgi:dTDP-4-dehydrorhamnose reductase
VIVVTGASGQLGTAFRSILPEDSVFLNRNDLDLVDLDRIAPLFSNLRPTTVLNCAAYTDVDDAEADEEAANTVNGYAVEEMALACRLIGAQFVTISTDYVFDGSKCGPYVESDETSPLNAYGRSKAFGETLAISANTDTLVVRTSWLLSGTHQNFVTTILERVGRGGATVVSDQFGTPTFVEDLAPAIVTALAEGVSGILHLANEGGTSWYELAREAVEMAGMDSGLVQPCATSEYPTTAQRPLNSMLSSERLADVGLSAMPHYRTSLDRTVSNTIETVGFPPRPIMRAPREEDW